MSISKNFILKHVGDEYMIIPLTGTGINMTKTFNINETGAFIYRGLEDGKNTEEIAKDMIKDYSIDLETALNDVKEFINILIKKGIYNE